MFIGDVVGRSGRRVVLDELPRLRARYQLDFVAVNGENAAGGFGITEPILEDLLGAGADVVKLGNHAFDQKDPARPARVRACSGPPTGQRSWW